MSDPERAFVPRPGDFDRAIELLSHPESIVAETIAEAMPSSLPELGCEPDEAIERLSRPVLGGARTLGVPGFFAHMDPPTPWLTWVMHAWIASRNQNLLHRDTAPVARDIEALVVDWLAPYFGMNGGHMTPGSTVANLTAIWAAREAGATAVVATHQAHVSVAKGAHLLAMEYRTIDSWTGAVPVGDAVAVITAGTTSTGEIEPLDAAPGAAWRHVDAAWAGPLRLSERHRDLLAGIETADSVAVSAHKWLFQPKESALVFFADSDAAHRSVSFGADYLAVPNVGVLGSHGATAVPLIATLLAYGRAGVGEWIDRSMTLADELAALVEAHPDLEARTSPNAGVLNWRHREVAPAEVQRRLPNDVFVSTTTINEQAWLRSVAANPMADPQLVVDAVLTAAAPE